MEYSWKYANSRIPLSQLVANIRHWTHSAGYLGKVKTKKDTSTLIINKGPGTWKGKVKLSVSGTQQMFDVQLDTGRAPFDNVAQSLPQAIEHYTGATAYTPQPQIHAPPPIQYAPQPMQPAPQPVAQPAPQPVQPTPAPTPPPQARPQNPSCPTCNNDADFIEQYSRWYCYECQKYV